MVSGSSFIRLKETNLVTFMLRMNKSTFDPIDAMIFEEGLRIQRLFFDQDIDLMLVVLNNKMIIKASISKFKRLRDATLEQLQHYEISRTGVHWPVLDEDLSLRGFLKQAIRAAMQQGSKVA